VFDFESNGKHRDMGRFETCVKDLLESKIGSVKGSRNFALTKNSKNVGTIVVADVTLVKTDPNDRRKKAVKKGSGGGDRRATFRLQLQALQLKNVEWVGLADPFFELSHCDDNDEWLTVFRSKHVDNNLNPIWDAVAVSMDRLCRNDRDMPIRVSVRDFQESGNHRGMGQFETSVSGLIEARMGDNNDDLMTFKLMKKGKSVGQVLVAEASVDYSDACTVADDKGEEIGASEVVNAVVSGGPRANRNDTTSKEIDNKPSTGDGVTTEVCEMAESIIPQRPPSPISSTDNAPPTTRPTFIDYIQGGADLNMCIAIDFSDSNGVMGDPSCLHHLHPPASGKRNGYEKAIEAVVNIVTKYDSDQLIPVWGFGARFNKKL